MTEQCGFSGNPDLYGLGIRLSLYIQSLTVALVATFVSQSAYNSFLSNTNLSLFVSSWAIILKVSISRQIRGVELGIFPVLIGLAYMAVAILLKDWRNAKFLWGTILTTLATASYWLWFFWSGLDVLPISGCSRDYAFFFAKVDLYGWYRTMLKVGFIAHLVIYTFLGLILRSFMKSRPDNSAEDFTSKSKRLVKNMPLIALLAFAISSTELTISWNHIYGVSSLSTLRSVGQLVPLVVALGQFISVLYLALRGEEKMRVYDENESTLCPARSY